MKPEFHEKQHFAASRREKSRIVEPCSTVALFTLVNSVVFYFLFFFEKHGRKFSFFFLEKPV
jgi:hypothetical protein